MILQLLVSDVADLFARPDVTFKERGQGRVQAGAIFASSPLDELHVHWLACAQAGLRRRAYPSLNRHAWRSRESCRRDAGRGKSPNQR